MRKVITLLLLSFGSLCLWAEESFLSYSIDSQALVKDNLNAANELVKWTEGHRGYFILKSTDRVELRIPNEELISFREYLSDYAEDLIRWDQTSSDLRQSIQSNKASLEANQEILQKNLSYLDSSEVEGTLALEQEIRRLMNRIDYNKGSLRRLDNDRKYAYISVSLSFQDNSLPEYRSSPFNWINDLDMAHFINQSVMKPGFSFWGPKVVLPKGFALIDDKPVFLAMSPEGAKLRVKTVDNYPEQDIDFWQETLINHLTSRGYTLINSSEAPSFIADQGFTVSLWGLKLGQKEYLYSVGIRIHKKSIEVLELGGDREVMLDF
ncbi:DUF4349 domain-containing protein [Spirochaeta cellobiosiphila]|uniref:DUF4349 domain-containing protein n=1 Tax=Spirochaeta cellobiosiphila TaxID=504483 RepID=UPI000424A508|nr:DUF4349 domain-containing protein [Spirochaeta cellobiosiphila]